MDPLVGAVRVMVKYLRFGASAKVEVDADGVMGGADGVVESVRGNVEVARLCDRGTASDGRDQYVIGPGRGSCAVS